MSSNHSLTHSLILQPSYPNRLGILFCRKRKKNRTYLVPHGTIDSRPPDLPTLAGEVGGVLSVLTRLSSTSFLLPLRFTHLII